MHAAGQADYYTREDEQSRRLRDEFVAYVGRMFVLTGESEAASRTDAQAVLAIESQLALTSRRAQDLRDPLKNYHMLSIAE